jgi:beta-lactamase regulating signal transducer with metallopeptidase domain
MVDFLTALFRCSLSMSLVTLVYAAVLPLLSKRYAALWRYTAWLVIAAGWVVPVRPRIGLSLFPVYMVPATPVRPLINAVSSVPDAWDVVNVQAAVPLWQVLTVVWIAGAASVVLYHVLRHVRFMGMVRRWSKPVTGSETPGILDRLRLEPGITTPVGLRVCEGVTSPMLIGFFRPVILLPSVRIADDELALILKHELVHFRRHDLWHKALIVAATVLHWFNPVVYLMAKAVSVQCEISCDEQVLRGADFERRRQYGETIIGIVRNGAKPRTVLSTNFYGGKNGMKNRIFSIMDTKSKKTGIAIIGTVLAGIVMLGTVAAPIAADDSITGISGTTDDQRAYSTPNGAWRTAEGFRTWLDQEKVNLQSFVNNDAPGWSQERADNAITLYEQQLEDLENGTQYAMAVKGYDGGLKMFYTATTSRSVAHVVWYFFNRSAPPLVEYSAVVFLENGDTRRLGPYATKEECSEAVQAFCNEQVRAGNMTRQDADKISSELR